MADGVNDLLFWDMQLFDRLAVHDAGNIIMSSLDGIGVWHHDIKHLLPHRISIVMCVGTIKAVLGDFP